MLRASTAMRSWSLPVFVLCAGVAFAQAPNMPTQPGPPSRPPIERPPIDTMVGPKISGSSSPSAEGATIVTETIQPLPAVAKAVLSRNPEQVFLALKASPAAVDDRVKAKDGERAGYTPLMLATALPDAKIAYELIERGADVTALDDYNRSAVWYAAFYENVPVAEAIMSKPAAREIINVADNEFKRTPLHLAVRANTPGLVALLLKNGASQNQRDILGQTPTDFCKEHGKTDACNQL